MTRDGGCLVIASSDKKVHVLRLTDQREATMQVGVDNACGCRRGCGCGSCPVLAGMLSEQREATMQVRGDQQGRRCKSGCGCGGLPCAAGGRTPYRIRPPSCRSA